MIIIPLGHYSLLLTNSKKLYQLCSFFYGYVLGGVLRS